MGEQRVLIEWYGDREESIADVEADRDRLQQADASAELEVLEPMGVLPVVAFIVGSIAVVALVREISDLVCRIRRHGIIIDARTQALKIRKTVDLPGGTVIVIARDGASTTYNVCDGKVNLADLINAATGS
jgi:hypothetical protein